MIILLVGINAKYSHTNLAIRLIKAYADKYSEAVRHGNVSIDILELNINVSFGNVLRSIIEKKPDIVLFSTYIWNKEYVFHIARDLRRIKPELLIGLGGPEVSWSIETTFTDCACVDMLISGEGEKTICELTELISGLSDIENDNLSDIPGISIKNRKTGMIRKGLPRNIIDNLDIIPFPYYQPKLDFNPETRLVYYESSRGCPFSCAYCLSSIDKVVRYYSLERVLHEVAYFLNSKFSIVKFVDRTFNLDVKRYRIIWEFIRDHYNGQTLFHFEISAEYLENEDFILLDTMPEGSIQLEIGIQSINSETLDIVGRSMNLEKLAKNIRCIPRKIHTHVDLIAGLPSENLGQFSKSIDFAFLLHPNMLQLGFLKILSGTQMEKIVKNLSGYIWSLRPPYEVLGTPDISYSELCILKDVEHIIDTWYNSDLMKNALKVLVSLNKSSAFYVFFELSLFIRTYFCDGDLYLPRRPTDSFACMAAFITQKNGNVQWNVKGCLEYLKFDFLLQGKPGVFPGWYERHYSKKNHDRALESQNILSDFGGSRRLAYSRTEYESFLFDSDEQIQTFLFVYSDGSKKEKKVNPIKL